VSAHGSQPIQACVNQRLPDALPLPVRPHRDRRKPVPAARFAVDGHSRKRNMTYDLSVLKSDKRYRQSPGLA
jgi:hypothetical protein